MIFCVSNPTIKTKLSILENNWFKFKHKDKIYLKGQTRFLNSVKWREMQCISIMKQKKKHFFNIRISQRFRDKLMN